MKRNEQIRVHGLSCQLCGALAALAMFYLNSLYSVAAQTYTITDLGTLGGREASAYGLNARGQVVGWADTPYSRTVCDPEGCVTYFIHHAFLWTPDTPNGTVGTMEDLGGSSGTHSYSEARGVNNHGDVIGTFLWENGSAVKNAPGGYAINDAGEILVGSNIWQNGVYYPLGGFGSNVSGGYGINGFGQVVGEFRLTGDPNQRAHAFLWTPTMPNATNGTMIDLGTLGLFGEAYASGINPQGQVVGTSYSSDPFQGHAFVWTPTTPNGTNGSMTDLGPGIAFAINASGVIVGEGGWCPQSPCSGAVIWRNGVRTDLQGLIPPGSAVGLTLAYAINDSGQILAWTDGSRRALLLTPVAAPRLSTPSIQSNSQLRFTLLGEAGRSYTIQASTNLVNWTALTNFVSATGTNQFTDSGEPNFSRRFCRAVTP